MTLDPVARSQQLWQGQPQAPSDVNLQSIKQRAGRFRLGSILLNAIDYLLVGALAIIAVAAALAREQTLLKVGWLLLAAGAGYAVFERWRRMSSERLPLQGDAVTYMTFHLRQLERQRDAFRSSWRWYVAPVVPGLVTIVAGHALIFPEDRRMMLAAGVVLALGCIKTIAWMRLRAHWLQRRIEGLRDSLPRDTDRPL
jgi:hypothetical protein